MENLNYCFRIIFDNDDIKIYEHYTLKPELLISVFGEGGNFQPPVSKDLDDIIKLFYNRSKDLGINQETIKEIQIYNIATDDIISCIKFRGKEL